ncbi:MAG: hypothetical protein K0R90_1707 [Oscillospiraceae bacterium]|nr:hypothetical protein [Oscillospiraceae bacterium]
MNDIRVLYTKKDRAKYISHLDVNRLMQRVLKRSGLPVWYTEGFNPHMYLTFALPLSLGYESEYEIMDFRLTQDIDFEQVKETLNQHLPKGILVTSVFSPDQKPSTIVSSEYKIKLFSDVLSPKEMNDLLEEFLLKSEIMVTKKTKKGPKQLDIKPFVEITDKEQRDDHLLLTINLPAGVNATINPTLFTDSFNDLAEQKIQLVKVIRTKVFCEDKKNFS